MEKIINIHIKKLPEAMKFGIIRKPMCYTTVPNHSGDMPEGTLRAILKEAGIDPNKFLKM